jgi:hypothetical protein
MLLSLLYFALGQFLRVLTLGGDRDHVACDVEILVLRHQLRVLSRGRRVAAAAARSAPARDGRPAAAA